MPDSLRPDNIIDLMAVRCWRVGGDFFMIDSRLVEDTGSILRRRSPDFCREPMTCDKCPEEKLGLLPVAVDICFHPETLKAWRMDVISARNQPVARSRGQSHSRSG